jgi:hypothetical protein
MSTRPDSAGAPPVELESIENAERIPSEQRMVFVPTQELRAVPHARLVTVGGTFDVSLPVNPIGNFPLNSCEIEAVQRRGESEFATFGSTDGRISTGSRSRTRAAKQPLTSSRRLGPLKASAFRRGSTTNVGTARFPGDRYGASSSTTASESSSQGMPTPGTLGKLCMFGMGAFLFFSTR